MRLSNAQIKLLETLVKPWNEHTSQHPCTAYKMKTREVLLREGLVEEYHYPTFLNGAIRLSEKGKAYLNERTSNPS